MTRIDSRSADSLRGALATGQDALLAAIAAAGDVWEAAILPPEVPQRVFAGDSRAWTPRYACFHASRSELFGVGFIDETLRRARNGEPAASLDEIRMAFFLAEIEHLALWDELCDAPTALAALPSRMQSASDTWAELTDADLDLPAEVGEFNAQYIRSFGMPEAPETLRSHLTHTALHLRDHADQILSHVRP